MSDANAPLSREAAYVEIMVLMAMADGRLQDEEAERLAQTVASRREFAGLDEGALDGESDMVRDKVWKVEEEHCLFIALRLIDPNMGVSRSNAGRREETWRDEFAAVGLDCELPSDSSVGQKTLNTYLRPDKRTHRPRVHVHPRCVNTIMQMKRYQWDEHRQSLEKDQKQVPRQKNDDYPTLLKSLMNEMPTFRMATQGPVVINNFMGGAR